MNRVMKAPEHNLHLTETNPTETNFRFCGATTSALRRAQITASGQLAARSVLSGFLPNGRIDDRWVLDGPIDGETFRIYVEKALIPTLKPGDIVILDNLGSHSGKAACQLIRAADAKLFFLPKYSLTEPPSSRSLPSLKHLLLKRSARTVEAVLAAIGQILKAFTPQECANHFENAGYGDVRNAAAIAAVAGCELATPRPERGVLQFARTSVRAPRATASSLPRFIFR